jgi:DNA primase
MSFAEQLKSQLNIVDVVGQYVRLKRSGSAHRFVGLCPFHSEKTPSFSVHSANQFYYCFGCGATGDVFKFVQEVESLTFPEALKSLAERNGIPVPERQRPNDPAEQEKAALFEMQEVAAQLFQDNLRSPAGAEARSYLQSRGVSKNSIDEFRLGLSEASGQQLVSRLRKYSAEWLERSGLISRRQDGGTLFDRFRGRLMFPIHNEQGKVIAFGGRALRSGDEPKYLNSAESKIYKKSSVLYNLHRAKIEARKHDRMIVVEGYMDAIGVYASGVREVVAICGTALGTDQVRLIKSQVAQSRASNGQVILNLDPDEAGSRSVEKYIGAFLAEGLRLKVLKLPGGLDPDEYIQQNGADEYLNQLRSAPAYFHWLAERARERFDVHSVEGKVDAFKSIAPALQQVSDKLERAALTNQLADYFKLDRTIVADQLRQLPSAHRVHAQNTAKATIAVPPNELLLVSSLLNSVDAREAILHFLRTTDVLQLLELRSIFEAVLAMGLEGVSFSLAGLSQRLEPRMQRILTEISFSENTMEEDGAAQQALHCLRALEQKATETRSVDLKARIRELEQQGRMAEAMQLISQLERAQTARSKS